MTLPHGAFAPIPTPVDDRGLVEVTALQSHLAFLDEAGLDGALVLGTNGEFPSFDLGERLAVAEAAARRAGRLSLMLGVGSCALPEAVQLVRAASHFGFSSVLLPPPFYFRSAPVSGLAAFLRAVMDAAELPVLLYHIPQVTGVPITDALLDAVAGHPRFGGVKDSSGDRGEMARFSERLPDRSYLVGHDALVSEALAAGGAGSITASASVAPGLVVATQRDPSRQPELDAVRSLLERYGLGPAVKAVLRRRGIGAYRTRPPLVGLDDDASRRLNEELDALLTPPT